jgi:hypothetical protein
MASMAESDMDISELAWTARARVCASATLVVVELGGLAWAG